MTTTSGAFDNHELERLLAVRRLDLIGADPDPVLQRICRLACASVDATVAAIELLEVERTWVAAAAGTQTREVTLEHSFVRAWREAIDDGHLVVEDLAVRSELGGAWYPDLPPLGAAALVPLHDGDGHLIGGLTVGWAQPRRVDTTDRVSLVDLAALASAHLAELADRSLVTTEQDPDLPEAHDEVPEPVSVAEAVVAEAARAARLADEVRRLNVMFDNVPTIVLLIGEDLSVLAQTPSLTRVLGHPEPFVGIDGVLSLFHGEDRSYVRAQITSAPTSAAHAPPFIARVLTGEGSYRRVECSVVDHTSDPSVRGIVLTMVDVTERYLLGQMLTFQTTHDRLTGLANRHLLAEHVRPALARALRTGESVAFVTFNLSAFRQVNETLGRDAGDELLRSVAEALTSSVRASDSVGRLEGDEFAVLLAPIATASEARAVTERLLRVIEGPHSTTAGVSRVQASVGIALSVPRDDADQLMLRSARALQLARTRGAGAIELVMNDVDA